MRQSLDKNLLAAVLALGAISLLTIFASNRSLAASQSAFWVVGLLILFASSQFYYKNWQRLSLPFYLASAIALFLVYIAGETVRGSTRWIELGAFRFQPSEIAKVASVVLLASFFEKRSAGKVGNIFLSLAIISPVFALIFLEPDIGSSAAIIAVWGTIAYAAGLKKRQAAGLFLIFCALAVIGYGVLAPYQKERIRTFINPSRDPLDAGYNIIQSKIAIGSGRILGRGLGRGPQSQLNFLPESESDFIFASVAEQFGLLGAGTVILMYALFLIKVASIAKTSDRFGQLITIGAFGLFAYQFAVNVGMNMGIIPVTGITLPFVSYGGSSLIASLLLLGIVLASRSEKY